MSTPWHSVRAELWHRDRGICGMCNEPVGDEKWEIDHITPVAQGGSDCFDNLRVTHRRCNSTAGGKLGVAVRFHGAPHLGYLRIPNYKCDHCGIWTTPKFPVDMLEKLKAQAQARGMSLNQFVVSVLREYIETETLSGAPGGERA